MKGFLENRDAFMESMDDETQEIVSFFHAWHGWQPEPITSEGGLRAREIQGGDLLRDAVPSELLEVLNTRKFQPDFRYWLKQHKGQTFGGLQLVGEWEDNRRRRKLWSLRPV